MPKIIDFWNLKKLIHPIKMLKPAFPTILLPLCNIFLLIKEQSKSYNIVQSHIKVVDGCVMDKNPTLMRDMGCNC